MRWFVLSVLMLAPAPALAGEALWFDCTAWGTSHTGRYTFRISTAPCAVYWLELDRDLKIASCDASSIVAEKPFAVSAGWVLQFDLASGAFEDFTPTWSDRGRCVRRGDGSKQR